MTREMARLSDLCHHVLAWHFNRGMNDMSVMSDYDSLLQLGFGIGAGLSVFRAPLELRYSHLSTSIDTQLAATRNITTSKAIDMCQKLSDLRINLAGEYKFVRRWQRPFLYSCIMGSIINLITLIVASMYASQNVTHLGRTLFLIESVLYYLLTWLIIESFVRWRLRSITRSFRSVVEAH